MSTLRRGLVTHLLMFSIAVVTDFAVSWGAPIDHAHLMSGLFTGIVVFVRHPAIFEPPWRSTANQHRPQRPKEVRG